MTASALHGHFPVEKTCRLENRRDRTPPVHGFKATAAAAAGARVLIISVEPNVPVSGGRANSFEQLCCDVLGDSSF